MPPLPEDPRLATLREDVTLLADWLARTGFDVPPAYRLLLSGDPLIRARGQERIAAARANALDTSLDEHTCLAIARDDLSRLASPATVEGLRAAECPQDPLFRERQRELKGYRDAMQLYLILGGVTLTLALLTGESLLRALLGVLSTFSLHLSLSAGRRRSRAIRASRERRWRSVSRPGSPEHH